MNTQNLLVKFKTQNKLDAFLFFLGNLRISYKYRIDFFWIKYKCKEHCHEIPLELYNIILLCSIAASILRLNLQAHDIRQYAVIYGVIKYKYMSHIL